MAQEVVVFGRMVQGQVKLRPKTDDQNRPVMDKSTPPKQVEECYIGLAVPKNGEDWNRIYAAMHAAARGFWPQLFDAQGNCVLRDFAWKYIDGDGVDSQGKPYANREGFAGHYVLKLATRYLPKCYPAGQYGPGFEMAEPDKFIKCGHYIRVVVSVAANEVQPGGTAKCGLYLSPNKIEHVAIGPEIDTGGGMSAQEAFGNAGPVQLPPGAQPVGPMAPPAAAGGAPLPPSGAPAAAAPPAPVAAPAPLPPSAGAALPPPPGLPAPGGALPPPPGAATPPAPQRTLVVAPQWVSHGITIQGLRDQGHTDDQIVANGWGVWQ